MSESNTMYSVSLRWKMAQRLLPIGSFQKTKKNNLSKGSKVFWDHQDAVSEGLKPSLRLCSFKLCKKLFLKKKQGKTRIAKARRIRGPKMGQSHRGPINDPHTICDTF